MRMRKALQQVQLMRKALQQVQQMRTALQQVQQMLMRCTSTSAWPHECKRHSNKCTALQCSQGNALQQVHGHSNAAKATGTPTSAGPRIGILCGIKHLLLTRTCKNPCIVCVSCLGFEYVSVYLHVSFFVGVPTNGCVLVCKYV